MLSVFNIAGGVALLLYGIKLMSNALQSIAGDKMRQLMSTLTKTPLRGVFIGAIVTMLIQSSAGTTVMTVSFVNAGLLTLKQAIGIIMGANVGTTMTAQIIAFNIENFALPIVAVGVALEIFGRAKKVSYLGNGLIGLGLLFLGMHTMKGATNIVAAHQDLLISLTQNPILGILAGMILTILVQSSAATIGLTIALASQGLIGLEGAIPIILGDNIGTTFTAVIASTGSGRSAKQAAAAHVLFNLIGVVIFSLAFPIYKHIVMLTADDAARQIANAHLIFNIVNTIIFFPFVPLLAALIEKIIPNAEISEAQASPTLYLDHKLISASPAAAVEAVKDELMHMGSVVRSMLDSVRNAYFYAAGAKAAYAANSKSGYAANSENVNSKSERPLETHSSGKSGIDGYNFENIFNEFEKREHRVNAINRAIAAYASEIWQKGLGADVSTVLGCYVSAASDLERVGDHSENLMELCEGLRDNLSDKARDEFRDMLDTAEKSLDTALESLKLEDVKKADIVIFQLENKIDAQEKQYRKNHVDRLNSGECDPEKGVNFIDVLGNLERIGDHSNNIAGYTRDIKALNSKKSHDTNLKGGYTANVKPEL